MFDYICTHIFGLRMKEKRWKWRENLLINLFEQNKSNALNFPEKIFNFHIFNKKSEPFEAFSLFCSNEDASAPIFEQTKQNRQILHVRM